MADNDVAEALAAVREYLHAATNGAVMGSYGAQDEPTIAAYADAGATLAEAVAAAMEWCRARDIPVPPALGEGLAAYLAAVREATP